MVENQAAKTIDLDALRQSVFSAEETMEAARTLASTDPNDAELSFRFNAARDNHSISRGRFNRAFNKVVAAKREIAKANGTYKA